MFKFAVEHSKMASSFQSTPGQVQAAVKEALKVGYRHLDCAHIYQNEGEVVQGLKETFDEGKVTRDDVFITSKVSVQGL